MDDFEKQLQQQAIRPLPGEWRAEILSAAKSGSLTQQAIRNKQSFQSILNPFFMAVKLWQELIWPCRRVWVGMAAIWLVVLVWNASMEETPKLVAKQMPAPTPEMIAALREQRQMLGQLLDPNPSTPALPAPVTSPRSETREIIIRA